MDWLGIDVGGANLKIADGRGFYVTRPFPLWREPERLASELASLLAASPPAAGLAATMTGELADCFATKSAGVRFIVAALAEAAGARQLSIYLSDGRFVAPALACRQPLLAAAANWHAWASFAAREVPSGAGLAIDLGSTTCDVIPLADGRPAAHGSNDPERLIAGELIYTGVLRSPICAVTGALPWRGRSCPTAAEWFATTRDAYLLLRDLPEEPDDHDTADHRPATRAAARDRLAHAICADRDLFSESDARAAAGVIRVAQVARIAQAVRQVVERLGAPPGTVVLSGQGEFLLGDVLAAAGLGGRIVSLTDRLGKLGSRCATAHALAVLARERDR